MENLEKNLKVEGKNLFTFNRKQKKNLESTLPTVTTTITVTGTTGSFIRSK